MKLIKKSYKSSDFIRVRDFLVSTFGNSRSNWTLERWNFSRYLCQPFNDTVDTWPESVGIWEDSNSNIVGVVNSEGENEGEVFLQLLNRSYSKENIKDFINHGENNLYSVEDDKKFVHIRVNPDDSLIKEVLIDRGYEHYKDWVEVTSAIEAITREYKIPEGFKIQDGNQIKIDKMALAHREAFGYKEDKRGSFRSFREAPDYKKSLDIYISDETDKVAAFCTVWFDTINKIGILEPVGTIPEYRMIGLGKAIVYEAINRILNLGGSMVYVGSDDNFYLKIGFKKDSAKEVWGKYW